MYKEEQTAATTTDAEEDSKSLVGVKVTSHSLLGVNCQLLPHPPTLETTGQKETDSSSYRGRYMVAVTKRYWQQEICSVSLVFATYCGLLGVYFSL
jgi:hypothetical protein